MSVTKIAWTDTTWNPVVGCKKVSPGCANCYAETMHKRLLGMGTKGYEHGFDRVVCHEGALERPLEWRKPRRVFVNSMSDLFHPDVPFEFIDKVFGIMVACPEHTFQILTKRPERMREYMTHDGSRFLRWGSASATLGCKLLHGHADLDEHHAPSNVWLGTSCENQPTAFERIPYLRNTPAAVRFISYEPALGPTVFDLGTLRWIDWLIIGGESGSNHRPMQIEWLESIVDQCKAAEVPVFVKQDSGPRPGMQGRIPDRLWLKEFPEAVSVSGVPRGA